MLHFGNNRCASCLRVSNARSRNCAHNTFGYTTYLPGRVPYGELRYSSRTRARDFSLARWCVCVCLHVIFFPSQHQFKTHASSLVNAFTRACVRLHSNRRVPKNPSSALTQCRLVAETAGGEHRMLTRAQTTAAIFIFALVRVRILGFSIVREHYLGDYVGTFFCVCVCACMCTILCDALNAYVVCSRLFKHHYTHAQVHRSAEPTCMSFNRLTFKNARALVVAEHMAGPTSDNECERDREREPLRQLLVQCNATPAPFSLGSAACITVKFGGFRWHARACMRAWHSTLAAAADLQEAGRLSAGRVVGTRRLLRGAHACARSLGYQVLSDRPMTTCSRSAARHSVYGIISCK